MKTWYKVGTLVKTKKLEGGLILRRQKGSSFLSEKLFTQVIPGVTLEFIPPQHELARSAAVSSVQVLSETELLVYFEGFTSKTEAEALVGMECLLASDALKEPVEVEHERTPLGLSVWTAEGRFIGKVVDLIDNPGQTLLSVEADEESGKEPQAFSQNTSQKPAQQASQQAAQQAAQQTAQNTSQNKTYLIPFVEDFIVSLDYETAQMVLDLPQGLLEL